jgi:hypothetical protein
MNISLRNISDRLEELVLHVINMSENDKRFMSTKLNKLVWAADFAAFCQTGITISRANYQREKYGPVPKAMPIIMDRLEAEGRIEILPVEVGSKSGVRPVGRAAANLSSFSQDELALIDKVIAENFGKTGTQLSEATHSKLAWKVLKNGETIPFAAWLVNSRKPTQSEIATAERLQANLEAA